MLQIDGDWAGLVIMLNTRRVSQSTDTRAYRCALINAGEVVASSLSAAATSGSSWIVTDDFYDFEVNRVLGLNPMLMLPIKVLLWNDKQSRGGST